METPYISWQVLAIGCLSLIVILFGALIGIVKYFGTRSITALDMVSKSVTDLAADLKLTALNASNLKETVVEHGVKLDTHGNHITQIATETGVKLYGGKE